MNSNESVIKAFFESRSLRSTSMLSTGNKLFSYNTCIIERVCTGSECFYAVNATQYSPTTSKHLNMAKRYFKNSDIVIYIDKIEINTQSLWTS